jgi:uncharacterized protein YjbJ (UPF0337 family)
MAPDEKFEHKGEEVRGEAKEKVGRAIGDDRLERQGETDKTSAKVKQAGDKVKDAAGDVKDRVTRDKDDKTV